MKKIFLLIAIVVGVTLQSMAQEHEIGLTVGSMYGVSYKTNVMDNLRLQVDLGVNLAATRTTEYDYSYQWGYFTFEANPNVAYQNDFYQTGWGNFSWYAGGGISLGLLKQMSISAEGYTITIPVEDATTYGKWGVNAVGGINLKLNNLPLAFSFDFRPGYGLGFYPYKDKYVKETYLLNFFDWKLVLGVRYCL